MAIIRVSIVEDDQQARESLAVLFNGTLGFRCVSTHGSTEDALKKLPVNDCDVVLLDLSLPGASGIECARELKRRRPALLLVRRHLLSFPKSLILKNSPTARSVSPSPTFWATTMWFWPRPTSPRR